ncbi:hypothetical protein AMATHDRAFT_87476 [Amanita thiersii Skay4041]|uniref:Protein kinase domain-containing protein n=1 Tax=Amanita thiersii Skay4041 TaxID=703135 RepID=A0A2A9NA05_9AGAR|nr:hypothetical protein AMATHDRAFT_87476 [Amanita thiersii Skay4041]
MAGRNSHGQELVDRYLKVLIGNRIVSSDHDGPLPFVCPLAAPYLQVGPQHDWDDYEGTWDSASTEDDIEDASDAASEEAGDILADFYSEGNWDSGDDYPHESIIHLHKRVNAPRSLSDLDMPFTTVTLSSTGAQEYITVEVDPNDGKGCWSFESNYLDCYHSWYWTAPVAPAAFMEALENCLQTHINTVPLGSAESVALSRVLNPIGPWDRLGDHYPPIAPFIRPTPLARLLLASRTKLIYSPAAWQRVLDVEEDVKRAKDSRGKDARMALDSIKLVLCSRYPLDMTFRYKLRKLMLDISINSAQFPPSLFLTELVELPLHPHCGGGNSDIFLGKLGGVAVAINRMRIFESDPASRSLKRKLQREVMIGNTLGHPFILPCIGIHQYFSSSRDPIISLVSPWMKNGNITNFRNSQASVIRETDLQFWLLEIAEGMRYLRQEGIVHGDLKGPNILLDDDRHVNIADSGLSRLFDSSKTRRSPLVVPYVGRHQKSSTPRNQGKSAVHSNLMFIHMAALYWSYTRENRHMLAWQKVLSFRGCIPAQHS